jgi:membrane-associated phospholipid phosphatase
VRILLAPALCLFLVTVLRYVINRPRPYCERGAGIIPLVDKRTQDKSFPSRHTASAFVLALTLLPYALWAGIPLLILACGVGLVRFALGLHYPSDIIAGAGIGILCGLAGILL